MNDIDPRYRSFILLSADSVERLRKCDVERVVFAASDAGKYEFCVWLKEQRPDLVAAVDAAATLWHDGER